MTNHFASFMPRRRKSAATNANPAGLNRCRKVSLRSALSAQYRPYAVVFGPEAHTQPSYFGSHHYQN